MIKTTERERERMKKGSTCNNTVTMFLIFQNYMSHKFLTLMPSTCTGQTNSGARQLS